MCCSRIHISNQLSHSRKCSLSRALTGNAIRRLSKVRDWWEEEEKKKHANWVLSGGTQSVAEKSLFETRRIPLRFRIAESNRGFFIEPANTKEGFSHAPKTSWRVIVAFKVKTLDIHFAGNREVKQSLHTWRWKQTINKYQKITRISCEGRSIHDLKYPSV